MMKMSASFATRRKVRKVGASDEEDDSSEGKFTQPEQDRILANSTLQVLDLLSRDQEIQGRSKSQSCAYRLDLARHQ
jgi:hypothetical protein